MLVELQKRSEHILIVSHCLFLRWMCKLDFIFSGVSCAVSNNVFSIPLWILCQRNLKFFCDMFLGNATNKSMDKDIC